MAGIDEATVFWSFDILDWTQFSVKTGVTLFNITVIPNDRLTEQVLPQQ
jgi:hypothetical protein